MTIISRLLMYTHAHTTYTERQTNVYTTDAINRIKKMSPPPVVVELKRARNEQNTVASTPYANDGLARG